MDGENYLFTAFRRLMISAGFTASFVGVAAYLLIPQAPLAIIIGGIIGVPTGVATSSAKTTFWAIARAAGIWAALLGVFVGLIASRSSVHDLADNVSPYLAFLATVVSVPSLGAGCSHIFCRAIAPEVGQPARFQLSLAEALALLALLAICVGSALWWKRLTPELFEMLANPGFRTSPPA